MPITRNVFVPRHGQWYQNERYNLFKRNPLIARVAKDKLKRIASILAETEILSMVNIGFSIFRINIKIKITTTCITLNEKIKRKTHIFYVFNFFSFFVIKVHVSRIILIKTINHFCRLRDRSDFFATCSFSCKVESSSSIVYTESSAFKESGTNLDTNLYLHKFNKSICLPNALNRI